MKTTRHPEIRAVLCGAFLAIIAGCAEERAATRPEPAAAQTSARQAVAEPTEPKAILMRMAEFLAKSPRFSVNLRDNYDAVPGIRPEDRIRRNAKGHREPAQRAARRIGAQRWREASRAV